MITKIKKIKNHSTPFHLYDITILTSNIYILLFIS